MNHTIAIIGAGNMGKSLSVGLIQHGGYTGQQIWVSSPCQEELTALKHTSIHTTTHNQSAIKTADVVILAVKPQIIFHITSELRESVQQKRPLVISIAAGIREKNIQNSLGGQVAIVRAMPNTPAIVGCGATGLYANAYVTVKQRELAESLLNSIGITCWVDHEDQLDTVTALSGSGPAYFFLVLEALQTAGEKLGLPGKTAHLLALQTALGAAKMAFETNISLSLLRKQVTSPGGTTEQGIAVLEKHHIHEIFLEALSAAKQKAEELGLSQE